MGEPTFWEVHEYVEGSPALAFTAGAGGHAGADEYGTVFYVNGETGWRDSAGMYETSSDRLMADGAWTGPQYKQAFTIGLSGYYVGSSQQGVQASMRRARNVLGRQWRTGRLLADESGHRLYADVTRGGPTLFSPSSPLVGNWSMSFKVDNPVYLSEQTYSTNVRTVTGVDTGMGFPVGYPMAFQTSSEPPGSQTVVNGGDVVAPFVATIRGPLSGFTLTDQATGRVMKSTLTIPSGQVATLDTGRKTFRLGAANVRNTLSGQWFGISPGSAGVVFTPLASSNANTQCTITAPAEAWGG